MSVNLAWDRPTVDANGQPLVDLVGYKVYASKIAGSWGAPVAIINPPVESYSFTPTSSGTWYFVATATNTTGDSNISNQVSTVVAPAIPAPPANLRIA